MNQDTTMLRADQTHREKASLNIKINTAISYLEFYHKILLMCDYSSHEYQVFICCHSAINLPLVGKNSSSHVLILNKFTFKSHLCISFWHAEYAIKKISIDSNEDVQIVHRW